MELGNNRGKVEVEKLVFILGAAGIVVFAVIMYVFFFAGGNGKQPSGSEAPEPETTRSAPPASPSPKGACRPGEVQKDSCNPHGCSVAGSRQRFCGEDGSWEPWGACSGCAGTVEKGCTTPGGCPGTSSGSCDDSCGVAEWSACRSDGECSPSEKRCVDKTSYRVCGPEDCLWGDIRACPSGTTCRDGECVGAATAVCKPGASERKSCNPSGCPQAGVSTRVCNKDGMWTDWSDCSGCGGRECTGDAGYRQCSNDCSWTKEVRCGSDEECSGGECVSTAALLTKRERPGPGGQLRHYPLKRKNGEPILTAASLLEAYAAGEIIVFRDGKEISVPQKPSSRAAGFVSTEFTEFAGGKFVSMGSADCRKLGTPLLNAVLRVASAPGRYARYEGRTYEVSFDYTEGCQDCGEAGPCFAPKGFDLGAETREAVKDWKWEVFTNRLTMGGTATGAEIAIDPARGVVSGSGSLEVSYYH